MTVKYMRGDLFTHSALTGKSIVLAHACNTGGSWGGGIAAVFARKYPKANRQYSEYCHRNSHLLGTSLLLKADDYDKSKAYIACLFTSDFNQSPEQIVKYTDQSLQELAKQLKSLPIETQNGNQVVNMPKINSGIFGVPWENTEAVLDKFDSLDFNVYVID